MTKVFIGGSRKVSKLPSAVEKRLENIINNNFTVLVGDANGADKCVQRFLAASHYKYVTVFCMNGTCRNNVGDWEMRRVVATTQAKGFSFYATKDLEMAKEASYGFMIWDAKSNGTLNNMINLLKGNKKVLVYFAPEKLFRTLGTLQELSTLLAKCDRQSLEVFEEKLGITRLLENEQVRFEFV